MLKSYYEILNLPENATRNEIKKQFKKLAKLYHPDINPTKEAEEMFKEINRASEVLLDEEKRKTYDNLRKNYKKVYNSQSSNYSFYDIFKKKENKKEKQPAPFDGDDITIQVEIDYLEALVGTQRSVNISRSFVCPKCLGKKFANGLKCLYCNGLGEKNQNRKITVKIPPNLKNGAKLRIKGEGQIGKYGGKNGNLYVIVNIEEQKDFQIKDNVVYCETKIEPFMAILGGNIKVPTLWGEAVIKIPPLTKNNQSFKLVDVGVLDKKTNKKGEQIVKVIVQIPNEITFEEQELYKKLQEISLRKNVKSI